MSMLNSTSKHRNFGISFGKTAARLEMVKLLRYHYAIRYVKKNDEIMRKNAMASSISSNVHVI